MQDGTKPRNLPSCEIIANIFLDKPLSDSKHVYEILARYIPWELKSEFDIFVVKAVEINVILNPFSSNDDT